MASAFSHALAAIAIGKVGTGEKMPWKFWILGMACAAFPDIDVLAFKFGIPYQSVWGHRGFTHSLFFAGLLALLVNFVFYSKVKITSWKWLGLLLYFFLCTASHGILDAMTTGGKGIAFFAPFDETRYFLPWQVIKVSPLTISRFFSEWGWKVIRSEMVWVGIPVVTVIGLCYLIRSVLKRK